MLEQDKTGLDMTAQDIGQLKPRQSRREQGLGGGVTQWPRITIWPILISVWKVQIEVCALCVSVCVCQAVCEAVCVCREGCQLV